MLQNRLFKLRGAHNDLGLSTGAALALLVVLILLPAPGFAQSGGLPAFNVTSGAEGEQTYSLSLQILALMSGIAILPSLLLGMTAFTRIIIVLSIMRQALGTQQTPPNQVLVSIALFLTIYIMTPTFQMIYDTAVSPYLDGNMDPLTAIEVGGNIL